MPGGWRKNKPGSSTRRLGNSSKTSNRDKLRRKERRRKRVQNGPKAKASNKASKRASKGPMRQTYSPDQKTRLQMERTRWKQSARVARLLDEEYDDEYNRYKELYDIGVKTGVSNGKPVITPIGEFDAPNDTYGLQLVFDCNTRGTRRIRGQV